MSPPPFPRLSPSDASGSSPHRAPSPAPTSPRSPWTTPWPTKSVPSSISPLKAPSTGPWSCTTRPFSAKKYISYALVSPYVLRLTLTVPKTITECYGPSSSQAYYFSINLNDRATDCPRTYDVSGNTFLPLTDVSGSVTLTNNSSTSSVTISYLCVGGGTGNPASGTGFAGGGGGGFVTTGTFSIDANSNQICNYSIGSGGAGGDCQSPDGSPGGTTTLTVGNMVVVVDVSGGSGSVNGKGGNSGFMSTIYSGGQGCSSGGGTTEAGGGGAGASADGETASCSSASNSFGGTGGNGYQWIDTNYYGGGGGGVGIYSGARGMGGGGTGGGIRKDDTTSDTRNCQYGGWWRRRLPKFIDL